MDERRFDDAIARLGESNDPEALYLLGRAWAGKAQAAPGSDAGSRVGGAPAGPALKPEEEQALAFYERATAARPDHAGAHLATARAPRAARPGRRAERGRAARAAGATSRRRASIACSAASATPSRRTRRGSSRSRR